MSNFYDYLKYYGANTDADYPYEGKEKKVCNYNANKIVGKVAQYKKVNSVDEMKERVA